MDETIDIARASVAERDAFIAIYEEALPPSERKPTATILAQAETPDFRVLLRRGGGGVEGFAILYVPAGEDFAMLEYLAVDHRLRGQGTGAAIMAAILEAVGERLLIVEIETDREETPDRDTRVRRRLFYERAGAHRVAGLHYRMPRVGADEPPAMDLMLHPRGRAETVTPGRAAHWIRKIYRDVYDVGIGEDALHAMLRNMPETAVIEAGA